MEQELSEFNFIKNRFLELKGRRDLLKEQLKEKQDIEKILSSDIIHAEEARTIIQTVAKKTQENLEFHISGMVSSAIEAVFPDPPEFSIEFAIKRGKTECELSLVRDGEKMKPMQSSGGGLLDVISFALRLAYWALKKNRHVMILDEPFKFVSVDLQPKCSQMVKSICDRLNLQVIMVSHLPYINERADAEFRVALQGGITRVTSNEVS